MKAFKDLHWINETEDEWKWSEIDRIVTAVDNFTLPVDTKSLLLSNMGAKRKDIGSVIILTSMYAIIFLSGVIGNFCTCAVILKNSYMHTATNYYLFNLAVSDVLTLLIALPPEMYAIWEAYPWRFGEPFCIVKSFLSEVTYYASVLTLTAFTLERYVAICHPIKAKKLSSLPKAVKVIIITWILASVCALPYAICTRVFYYVTDLSTGKKVKESLLCNIPQIWIKEMTFVFQVSTFAFFVAPMSLITVMYVRIGRKIRKSDICTSHVNRTSVTVAYRARRAVLRMLVAVVVAFFICWAPFHAQRLMTLYIKRDDWNEELIVVQSHLFYVSGILYFFSSTVNPILYNLMSRKYRQAFKRTLCRCCLDMEGLPAFYKLRAKFNDQPIKSAREPSSIRCIYPEKHQIMSSYNDIYHAQETRTEHCKENYFKMLAKRCDSFSESSYEHTHSDGRLQFHCRCKSSRCRTERQLEGPLKSRSYNNLFQKERHTEKRKQFQRSQPTTTFDFMCKSRHRRIDATLL